MTADAVNPGAEPSAGAESVEKKIDNVLKTRTGYTWAGLVIAALLGILVLIFILQNLENARVEFFAWTFQMPIGVLVLLAIIIGALVMGLVGGWRIFQLRRAAKKAAH
ncbi:LapA family protein [Nocardia acididurans]|nr:lipopolysaccharide assembly protein LapA domain-containing protein [Nocardia acididurans]